MNNLDEIEKNADAFAAYVGGLSAPGIGKISDFLQVHVPALIVVIRYLRAENADLRAENADLRDRNHRLNGYLNEFVEEDIV